MEHDKARLPGLDVGGPIAQGLSTWSFSSYPENGDKDIPKTIKIHHLSVFWGQAPHFLGYDPDVGS